jgi:hypothetical protein
MKLTFPKVGSWSPLRFLKIQSSITGVKTLCIGVFFMSLERSWSVNVQNGLAWAIWTSQPKLWAKKGSGVKLAIWLPTIKSRESTRIWCLQEECNMALEFSQKGLQDWFIAHPNRRSEQEVMVAQSPRNVNRDSFEIPLWESREKVPFKSSLGGELQRILYAGRWWLPQNLGRGESNESKLPVTCPNTKGVLECELTHLWLVLDVWSCNKIIVPLLNLILKLLAHPSHPL